MSSSIAILVVRNHGFRGMMGLICCGVYRCPGYESYRLGGCEPDGFDEALDARIVEGGRDRGRYHGRQMFYELRHHVNNTTNV